MCHIRWDVLHTLSHRHLVPGRATNLCHLLKSLYQLPHLNEEKMLIWPPSFREPRGNQDVKISLKRAKCHVYEREYFLEKIVSWVRETVFQAGKVRKHLSAHHSFLILPSRGTGVLGVSSLAHHASANQNPSSQGSYGLWAWSPSPLDPWHHLL